MPRVSIIFWCILAVLFGVEPLLAANGYVVGNCVPALASFATISAAVSSVPAGSVVRVCPGTYPEQVTISQSLTLEGISAADGAQAMIVPPPGGLTQTAPTDDSNSISATIAYQVWVNNAPGPVNISNITVDGTGNDVTACGIFFGFSGIFYQNTPGTVDRVTVRNENVDCNGNGIFVEGGSSDPSVTIQNSSVHDFNGVGIVAEGPSSGLKATIKNNYVNNPSSSFAAFGIWLDCCSSTLVTGNVVVGSYGIGGINTDFNGSGSVAGNTIIHGGIVANGPASVTSNNILDSPTGIYVGNSSNSIKSNTITNSTVGIEFFCVANPNVSSNVINDAGVGVHNVPAGVATPKNSYFNVLTIRTTC